MGNETSFTLQTHKYRRHCEKKKLIATANWRQGIVHPRSSEITIMRVAPRLRISPLKPLNILADSYDLWHEHHG